MSQEEPKVYYICSASSCTGKKFTNIGEGMEHTKIGRSHVLVRMVEGKVLETEEPNVTDVDAELRAGYPPGQTPNIPQRKKSYPEYSESEEAEIERELKAGTQY